MATLLGKRLLSSFQFKVCGVLSLVASNYNTLPTLLLPVVPTVSTDSVTSALCHVCRAFVYVYRIQDCSWLNHVMGSFSAGFTLLKTTYF